MLLISWHGQKAREMLPISCHGQKEKGDAAHSLAWKKGRWKHCPPPGEDRRVRKILPIVFAWTERGGRYCTYPGLCKRGGKSCPFFGVDGRGKRSCHPLIWTEEGKRSCPSSGEDRTGKEILLISWRGHKGRDILPIPLRGQKGEGDSALPLAWTERGKRSCPSFGVDRRGWEILQFTDSLTLKKRHC